MPSTLAVALSLALAAATPKIAVLELRPISEELKPTAMVLEQVTLAEIPKLGRYEVIARADIVALLGYDRQQALLGCSDDSCVAQIGGSLGADFLLSGNVGRVGRLFHVDLRLVDVRRSKAIGSEATQVEREEDLVQAVRGLLPALLAKIPQRGGPAPSRSVAAPAPSRIPAVVLLAGGGLAAATGTALFLGGRSFNDRELDGVPFATAQQDRQRSLNLIRAGSALGLLGVGSAAVGAWLLLTGPASPSVVAAPVAGGGAVTFAGTFP